MSKILFAAYLAVGFCMGTLLSITNSIAVVVALCTISVLLIIGAVAMVYESKKSKWNKNF